MTIEGWNIVLSTAILVLMTCGGIWLKYVVDQQLKSKDSAIQALEGIVKLKDAQIAGLEGDVAPAIAKNYATMRDHAEHISQRCHALTQELANLSEKQKSSDANRQLLLDTRSARTAICKADGLMEAREILSQCFDDSALADNATALEERDYFIKVVDSFIAKVDKAASEEMNRVEALLIPLEAKYGEV